MNRFCVNALIKAILVMSLCFLCEMSCQTTLLWTSQYCTDLLWYNWTAIFWFQLGFCKVLLAFKKSCLYLKICNFCRLKVLMSWLGIWYKTRKSCLSLGQMSQVIPKTFTSILLLVLSDAVVVTNVFIHSCIL